MHFEILWSDPIQYPLGLEMIGLNNDQTRLLLSIPRTSLGRHGEDQKEPYPNDLNH